MVSGELKERAGQHWQTGTGGCHVSPMLPWGRCCTGRLHGSHSSQAERKNETKVISLMFKRS